MTLAILVVGSLLTVVLVSAAPRWLELRRARRRAQPAAHLHDELTGLPSRAWLHSRLDQVLARAKRHGFLTAVLVLDLDRFAAVNNRMGHEQGDQVFVLVARRLQELARTEDTVARLDGDQFVVLLEDVADPNSPARVAQRIIESFRTPLLLGEIEVTVSLSIGVAICGSGDASPSDLLRDGSLAMQRAKQKGNARFESFDSESGQLAINRLILEARLRDAASEGELVVHYQPVVVLATREIVGMEALVRWQHPVQGLLSPDQFVPVAEEAGLIVQIDRWVLEHAGRFVARLDQQGLISPRFRLNVNVSVHNFGDRDFLEHIALTLARSGLAPERLVIEITETGQEIEPLTPGLEQLRLMGVGVALDDFGIGYSSLSRLRSLPVSVVKIDQEFVRGITEPSNFAIVHSITDLANVLGMEVIAEGIETQRQLELVRSAGCKRGQGYLFSRPVPEEQIGSILAQGSLSPRSGEGFHGSSTVQVPVSEIMPSAAQVPVTTAEH